MRLFDFTIVAAVISETPEEVLHLHLDI